MDAASRSSMPVEVAATHAIELLDDCGVAADLVDVRAIAEARPSWPVWPQVALSELVGPPGRVLDRLDLRWLHRFQASVGVLDQLVAAAGGPEGGPSALSLLVERAQMLGHRGWGTWSAGTSCRLLRAADAWVAVNLARDEDLEAVPAIVGAQPHGDPWTQLVERIDEVAASEVVERAQMLGVPAAAVPGGGRLSNDPQRQHRGGERPRAVVVEAAQPTTWPDPPLVVDLSALWAGPLTGWYLARAGARVVKVESTSRPDGARRGTPAFWNRLNAGKELVELDLANPDGHRQLADLIAAADVVIEASRPRALESMGIDAAAEVGRGCTWCSITGYGRSGPWADRVAFGDDAAAAGGLVTMVDDEPWFLGDAAADPIAGVTAAAAVLGQWLSGRSALVDVAMRDAVAGLTGGVPVPSALA